LKERKSKCEAQWRAARGDAKDDNNKPKKKDVVAMLVSDKVILVSRHLALAE
jgi:hypothetical protein